MKNKILIHFLIGCLLIGSLSAQVDMELEAGKSFRPEVAGRDTYVSFVGTWVDNNTDGTLGGGLRLGWNFQGGGPYFISTDVEFEAMYWKVDSEVKYGSVRGTAETENVPMMVNLRVNFPLADTGLFLYGGGGAGVSYLAIKGTGPAGQSVDDSGAIFTYAFFAGLGVDLSERVSLRAGYRALWLTDETFNDGSVKVSLATERNDMFELALRLGF